MNPYLSDYMFTLPSREVWLNLFELLSEYSQQFVDLVVASRLRKDEDGVIYEQEC